MTAKFILLSNLFIQLFTFAQFRYSPSVTDFKVSDDNSPSSFKQEGTRFFPHNSHGGLYTWQDYRLGEQSIFAQKIDSLGNKIGKNFEIFSDLDICFAPDGSFLVLGQSYNSSFSPYMSDGFYTIDGQIYSFENAPFPPFNVAGGIVPWCATGWLGIHNTLARTDSHYLNFHSSGGRVSFSKYDFNGNLVLQVVPNDSLLPNVYDLACASVKSNDYALFALKVSPDYSHGNLFGTFFSPSDSIIANNVLIDSNYFYANYYESNQIKLIALYDSTYKVFYLSQDSLAIYSWKANRNGSHVSKQPTLQLFKSDLIGININRWISNFAITPIIDDKFSLLVTVNESRYPSYKDFHSLFTFNKNGELIETQYDSSETVRLGKYFARTENNAFLIPSDYEQDAYQKTLSGFHPVDSLKLNDDLKGSNEISPIVHEINNNEMLISYVDEKNILCKKIDFNGNLLTKEIILNNRSLNFFSDGWSVGIWYESDQGALGQRVGYSIYDPNFNEKMKVYLTTPQQGNSNISNRVLSDSTFLLAFYDNKQLFIRLYNRNGEMKKERLLLSNVNNYQVSIYRESINSFLISTYQYAQIFNNELENISPFYSQQVFNYLGNNRVLSVSSNEYRHLYGQIFNLDGTQLTEKFFLTSSTEDYYINRLDDNFFAILYKLSNKLYIKCFTSSGNPWRDSLIVHSNFEGYRKSPRFTVKNGKVFFVWSDLRNIGSGYDIYGSIFNLSDITDIKDEKRTIELSEFNLFQNYPNPFNPSTKISWQSPVSGWQTLKVYDVLGNEVATLVDEFKLAGSYEVEFSASSGETIGNRQLASGVYYYQLRTGDFVQTKKMILLR